MTDIRADKRKAPMIRRARACDEAAILACAEQAYSRYIPLIGRRPAPLLADYRGQIAADQVWIAEDGSDLTGFIVFAPQGDVMLLENVAVLPAAAGRGIGRALINHCEAEARRLGLRAVSLYTNEKMVENIAIYPKLGYIETRRGEEDGFHRVWFEKPL
ncbi:GNAT family N-acetyltransferase [Rhodobacter sp. 24-YEA-8]|uniref:GNAT family N-acetyltransferase n=1 Tax=Rhodobacter sp. 24-YEA-8 TaxID=1884310 RepID=UPI00209ADE33|nr:GNAT family N-acetyltransferase [Rhodobacter sp. 24-YEA-8]